MSSFDDLGSIVVGDAASVITPLPLCKPPQRNANWRKHLLLHSFVLRIPHVNRQQLIPAVLVDLLHMVTPLPLHNGVKNSSALEQSVDKLMCRLVQQITHCFF